MNTDASMASVVTPVSRNRRVCGQEVGQDGTAVLFHSGARAILDPWMKVMVLTLLSGVQTD